ncbi:MAG: competence protein ComEA [Lachnospiraceae bacterium]|nr:competence protein ComEA [Lachnospiraceae bacterium]
MNNKDGKKGIIFLIVLVMSVVGIISFLLCYEDEETYVETSATDVGSRENVATETTKLLAVHIVGSVSKPGVYYVENGAIVNDVVKLAGGLTKDADVSVTNLASAVTQGMMIRIYSVEEVKKGEVITETSKGLININTAGKETLMELPGIGEAKAEAIISYREQNGAFKDIKDIMNIPGIKEALYNKIKDHITS